MHRRNGVRKLLILREIDQCRADARTILDGALHLFREGAAMLRTASTLRANDAMLDDFKANRRKVDDLTGFIPVAFDFTDGRAGVHAGQFLDQWRGRLVCDDYSGYKALFKLGVTEAGCMAHARRKLRSGQYVLTGRSR